MKTLVWIACAALPLLAQEPVRYEVSFPNAAHHEAEVRAVRIFERQGEVGSMWRRGAQDVSAMGDG